MKKRGRKRLKKILFAATITDHFYYFHLPYLKMFHDAGWEVHVASHGSRALPCCDIHHEIPIARSPFDKNNISAYKMLKTIIKENDFDIIHCHTPMGGMLTRLAAPRNGRAKIIYTAHGFHFYKGASALNWIIYFPIEKLMSAKTDCLITINNEDFRFAQKHFRHPDVKLINGVGYNSEKYFPVSEEEKIRLRKSKGYDKSEFVIIYVAEMNKNKNQKMLIDALALTENTRLIIAGADNYNGRYADYAKSVNVENRVDFLGHREDIDELLKLSDICAASSIREGLPVNIMEAMACGLPVVASDNRGHRALVKNGEDGFIVPINDSNKMAEKINLLKDNKELYRGFSQKASENIKRFSKEVIVEEMKKIYTDLS